MQVSHRFTPASAVFDDDSLVSCAGLVPVMTLAAQTGLPTLLADKIDIAVPRIKSGSANPSPKLTTVIAGMCAGADSIDDLDVVRSGGMKALFEGVYAPSTVGTLLREFTFGHARQLESVLREHLVALCERVRLLRGADQRAFIDIDSLLRPVYGHAKQGASYGHTKIAGKQILRKGLSPLITTISTEHAAPMITGARLRAGKTTAWILCAAIAHNLLRCARRAGRWYPRSSPRGHPAATHRHHPRPPGSTPTQTRPASTAPLALVPSLACPVAQHDRIQPTGDRNHLTNRRKARPENTQEKLGRPATRPCPPPETTATTLTAPHANR